jgi:hypothetical protein
MYYNPNGKPYAGYGRLTLREAGNVIFRQATISPWISGIGALAGLLLVDRTNKQLSDAAKAPKKKRKTRLSQTETLALVIGGAALVNLATLSAALYAASRN